ncbi:hypothetical protein C7M84_000450 [Penaeus vannamei]|uniref:Uncharacterized protein n=1 Tax=Penaeus vannamei TaxID=6689 RepID=A0A3R7MMG8_PENVA|nr:hypothetical protein C7M84_000450 [Penaeus vannamei]
MEADQNLETGARKETDGNTERDVKRKDPGRRPQLGTPGARDAAGSPAGDAAGHPGKRRSWAPRQETQLGTPAGDVELKAPGKETQLGTPAIEDAAGHPGRRDAKTGAPSKRRSWSPGRRRSCGPQQDIRTQAWAPHAKSNAAGHPSGGPSWGTQQETQLGTPAGDVRLGEPQHKRPSWAPQPKETVSCTPQQETQLGNPGRRRSTGAPQPRTQSCGTGRRRKLLAPQQETQLAPRRKERSSSRQEDPAGHPVRSIGSWATPDKRSQLVWSSPAGDAVWAPRQEYTQLRGHPGRDQSAPAETQLGTPQRRASWHSPGQETQLGTPYIRMRHPRKSTKRATPAGDAVGHPASRRSCAPQQCSELSWWHPGRRRSCGPQQ